MFVADISFKQDFDKVDCSWQITPVNDWKFEVYTIEALQTMWQRQIITAITFVIKQNNIFMAL